MLLHTKLLVLLLCTVISRAGVTSPMLSPSANRALVLPKNDNIGTSLILTNTVPLSPTSLVQGAFIPVFGVRSWRPVKNREKTSVKVL